MIYLSAQVDIDKDIEETAGTPGCSEGWDVEDSGRVVDAFLDFATRRMTRIQGNLHWSHGTDAAQVQLGHQSGNIVQAISVSVGGLATGADGYLHNSRSAERH